MGEKVTIRHKGSLFEVDVDRIMRYYENGNTYKDIAKGLGISRGQVRNIIIKRKEGAVVGCPSCEKGV